MEQQRTFEWYKRRLGHFTGSQIGNLFVSPRTKTEGKVFGETALTYIRKVASERLLPQYIVDDDEQFAQYLEEMTVCTRDMQRGIDTEDEARMVFELHTGLEVNSVGSCAHPEYPFFASSPDGLVGDDAVIEIKCPKPEVFVEYMGIKTAEDLKKINKMYYYQMQAEMVCTGRKKAYFVAYCRYVKSRIIIVEIDRDEDVVAEMLYRVVEAQKMADEIVRDATVIELVENS